MKKPWFRKGNRTWYVQVGTRQIPLGKEERTLYGKPKDPPPHVLKAYHELFSGQTKVDTLRLSDALLEYEKGMSDCLEETRRHTMSALKKFLKHTGDKKVTQLRPIDVTEYLRKQDWTDNTKWLFCNKLLACLNLCVREGLLSSNPLKGYRKPKKSRRTRMMTAEEQATLEAAVYPAMRDVLVALRLSGCRPGEICGLTIDRVDLEKGKIRVLDKNRKKTGKEYRTVFLHPELSELIRRKIGERTEGNVFLTSRGGPWTADNLTFQVWRFRKKLGLSDGVIPYAVRHRYASDAINGRDVNPALLARQLGHGDLKMLMQTYLTESDEAMLEAARKAAK